MPGLVPAEELQEVGFLVEPDEQWCGGDDV